MSTAGAVLEDDLAQQLERTARRRELGSEVPVRLQQLLALAQAFVAEPRVLLCDEPSLGVAQGLIPTILEFLRSLADSGVAVVVVEQLAEQALAVADHVAVLRQGVVVAEGPPAEFEDKERLRALFLG